MTTFIDIQNTLKARLFGQTAKKVVTTRQAADTNNTVFQTLSEEGVPPSSVEPIQVSYVFRPDSRGERIPNQYNIPEGAEPATQIDSSRWRYVVVWSDKVDHMDWISRVAYRGIHSAVGEPDSWIAELQSCETILSPDMSAEAGTRLLVTFIIRQR